MVRTKLFLVPVLLLTAVLSIYRVYFFSIHYDILDGSLAEIAFSLLHGIRFDLSTAMIASIPFLLTALLPFNRIGKTIVIIAFTLLSIWHVLLLGYNLVDTHFFTETQRHFSYDIIYGAGSVATILKMAYESFMIAFSIFGLGYVFLFIKWFYKYLGPISFQDLSFLGETLIRGLTRIVLLILLLGLAVLIIRGGVQDKPLEVNAAFISDNEAMGNLSLNGIYTTMQALWDITHSREGMRYPINIQTDHYKSIINKIVSREDEHINPEYPLFRRFSNNILPDKPLNVVLIIMESWTAKYTKATGGEITGAPFFDELSKRGLLLTNMFANAQRTFEGVMATVGSFPTWNYKLIGQGGLSYQTRLEPIGTVFRKMGYDTTFINGANPESLGLGNLMKRFGFTKHISKNDFTINDSTDDGTWGIYDEYVFQRAHEEFKQSKKPFFAVILSLSSHLPFKLPSPEFDTHKDQQGEMRDFLNSMAYSDFALRKFFEMAEKSSYYKDTLFVIVGDHVAGYFVKENLHEAYRIPALLLCERLGLSGVHDKAAFQVDVVPTILDLTGSDKPFTAWGRSIFSEGSQISVLPRGPSRVLVKEPFFLLANHSGPLGLFDYRKKSKENLMDGNSGLANKLYSLMVNYEAFSESIILNNKVRPPKDSAEQEQNTPE